MNPLRLFHSGKTTYFNARPLSSTLKHDRTNSLPELNARAYVDAQSEQVFPDHVHLLPASHQSPFA
ncbi:hypothetical protein SAMN05216167_103196 [Spirosoma endophyticum]|uniref:Uncharacterized protein n=1 Tax=Spirosoma endophyticum TaxID=662367 RepID=A0A1I1PJ79_9BACT|nr:hypothetical protein SAMN05216167_103196 [Spirosoma endophyticum]